MHYEGDIIRPPSEADSIILQATVGCSHNRCTFCGAYRDRQFKIKDEDVILKDLDFAAAYCRRQKTIFLADGDALAMPHQKMLHLLGLIRSKLPHVRRISLYANALDILRRSRADLKELKELGLGRIYMGLESGHNPTLQAIAKGADAEEMIRAGQRVRSVGIYLSVTVLLGIGGLELSQDHARATAAVINEMKPSQVAVLTLMILDNTPLARMYEEGTFVMPGQKALFTELRTMIINFDLAKAQFHANHASNYFNLDGRLPRDKKKFIGIIDSVLDGTTGLKPENSRAL